MTKPFDPTKPCQTRDGREAAVYKVWPEQDELHGAINEQGVWWPTFWNLGGRALTNKTKSELDLINIPERIEGWINVYNDSNIYFGELYRAKEDCDDCDRRAKERIACIKISFQEGDGL